MNLLYAEASPRALSPSLVKQAGQRKEIAGRPCGSRKHLELVACRPGIVDEHGDHPGY